MDTSPSSDSQLINLSAQIPNQWLKLLYQATSPVVDRMLGIKYLNNLYDIHAENLTDHRHEPIPHFFSQVLDIFNVNVELKSHQLENIPQEGPLLVVANHPLGGLDGLALASIIVKRRPDLRLIVNFLLGMIPELKPWLFTVDPFGAKDAAQKNLQGMKMAYNWLSEGHCIATFPSGTVSYVHPKYKRIQDPEWHTHLARLARKTNATVVPIYFSDHNSWLFQAASFIHPNFRTALLARELNKYQAPVRAHIGRPIDPQQFELFESSTSLSNYFRLNTYLSGYYADKKTPKAQTNRRELISLNLPAHSEKLKSEIERLPETATLYDSKRFAVVVADAQDIPHCLSEIGRLREVTFRMVGEGTGKSCDLDKHDNFYKHIILWDKEAHCIAGCYRIGIIDQILKTHGVTGVYSASLFDYQDNMLEDLGKAIELGRSFIVQDYQRTPALSYLWKGVGIYIAKCCPEYTQVIGPVSISPLYKFASQALMVHVLKQHYWDEQFGDRIKASRPPKYLKLNKADKVMLDETVTDATQLSALVSNLESDGKGIPALLKHYIKMNCKVMSFNIDPAFGNDLDVLMRLDLMNATPKLLRQYMTPEHYENFVGFHGLAQP